MTPPSPTAHAAWVAGGAFGAVLLVASAAVGLAAGEDASKGCSACWFTVAGACVVALVGIWLIRGAMRAMRASR